VSFILNAALFYIRYILMYIAHHNPASLAARSITTLYVCMAWLENDGFPQTDRRTDGRTDRRTDNAMVGNSSLQSESAAV